MIKTAYALIISVILMVLLLSGCKEDELIESVNPPAGVTNDTATARIETLANISVFQANVHAVAVPLYFGQTTLKIKDVFVYEGDYVKKGDIIASLDNESALLSIETQQKNIDRLKRKFQHENEIYEIDIELAKLENKSPFAVEKLELAYRQAKENQAFELAWLEKSLAETQEKLSASDLTAPFDGRIVKTINLYNGANVKPYSAVAYISNTSELYIKYIGTDFYTFQDEIELKATIGENIYEIERTDRDYDKEQNVGTASTDTGTPKALYFMFSQPNPSGAEAGQSVLITRTTSLVSNALVVPVNSLYYGSEGVSYVYLMEGNEKTLCYVKTGAKNETTVQILEGLKEGDVVFVKQ